MGRRRTTPVYGVGAFWNALTAAYGIPGSYGLAIEDILVDTGTTIPGLIAAISALLTPEIADILTDTGTDLPATLVTVLANIATINALLDPEIADILADVTGLAGAAMRGTDGAALASEYTAARAESLEYLGRSVEPYTFTLGSIIDNDSNFATVLEVASGRGILVGFGGHSEDKALWVKVTIDGVEVVSDIQITYPFAGSVASVLCFTGFDTSLKVEMRLGAAGAGRFWAVANVE